MSILREFYETSYLNKEKLLKTLEKLTTECQIQDYRDSLDNTLFLDLSMILKILMNSQDVNTLVLTESFKFLRNSVINNKQAQNFIRDRTDIIFSCLEFIKLKTTEDNSDEKLTTRCCLQFLANFMAGNDENCRRIAPSCNETLCALMKTSKDEKALEYTAMCLQILLKLNPEWVKELDVLILPKLFENTHLEFIMYVIETLAGDEIFMLQIFPKLMTEARVNLLKIVTAHTEIHNRFPQSILKFMADDFKAKSDLILKSQLKNDNGICWEISALLELLCCLTSVNTIVFQCDETLLITTVYLLRAVHDAGKVTNIGENEFSPVQNLSALRINAETEEMRSQPTFQFKAHLIRLIANLVHGNSRGQELVRVTEGMTVILDCCQIDARNPFITQWAVLAIRNLCEGCPTNQEFIRFVQRMDTVNALPNLSLIGL